MCEYNFFYIFFHLKLSLSEALYADFIKKCKLFDDLDCI